jgi:hypothetical protein
MTTVAEIVIAAEPGSWRDVGFEIGDDSACQVGGIRIRFVGGRDGIVRWVFADAPDPSLADIDGLATGHGDPPDKPGIDQPNGVFGIDHIVVNTPDLERTCDAIAAATDAPLKRIREAGTMRQGFHRLGELIVEVVSHPRVVEDRASFWGLALNVRDIDALFGRYGDSVISPPKDAVQPGRRIASFREAAALGVPVAVMSANPSASTDGRR